MRILVIGLLVIGIALADGSAKAQAESCDGITAEIAGAKRCVKPMDSFKDCATCPEMVVIAPGRFTMGSEETSDETPIHDVTLSRPVAVGKFEVTFAEWDACVADGACSRRPDDLGWGRGTRPVIDISWNDVSDTYLPWLSRKAGRRYRLLSEAEWEYAARGGSSSVYWWGDDVGAGHANCDGCGGEWDNKQTAPVGSFAPNAYGLHDMLGNVWEWTEDCYLDSYAGAPLNGSARTKKGCEVHVVRGGGWSDRPKYLRSAIRYGDRSIYRGTYVGFRVARTN